MTSFSLTQHCQRIASLFVIVTFNNLHLIINIRMTFVWANFPISLGKTNKTTNFKKRGSIFFTKWSEDGKYCCCGILMKLMKSCTNSIFFLFVTFLFVCSTAHHSAQVLLYYYRNFLAYQLTYYIAFTTCTLHDMPTLHLSVESPR